MKLCSEAFPTARLEPRRDPPQRPARKVLTFCIFAFRSNMLFEVVMPGKPCAIPTAPLS
jgi:hypothetical protein